MAETTTNPIETLEEMNNEAYIAAIEEMKANTVSKEAYNKLRAENKKLLDTLVSGEQLPQTPEEKPSIQDLRKKLFGEEDLSNYEYIKTALSLRDALIESGERDPFLPVGDKVDITTEQIENAQKVADGLSDMLDFAEGDSGVFSAEYQRRVKDISIPRGRR